MSVCVSPALPKEVKARKERERDFMDGGIELEEGEKRQVMEKGFEGEATESISQMVRKALKDESSLKAFGFYFCNISTMINNNNVLSKGSSKVNF